MTPLPPITTTAVMHAVYTLGRNRHPTWPTAQEIADWLEAPEPEVLGILRDLKGQRLFRDRTRQKRRVWMPWDAV